MNCEQIRQLIDGIMKIFYPRISETEVCYRNLSRICGNEIVENKYRKQVDVYEYLIGEVGFIFDVKVDTIENREAVESFISLWKDVGLKCFVVNCDEEKQTVTINITNYDLVRLPCHYGRIGLYISHLLRYIGGLDKEYEDFEVYNSLTRQFVRGIERTDYYKRETLVQYLEFMKKQDIKKDGLILEFDIDRYINLLIDASRW